MRRSLLAIAAIVAGSAPASACIWDSELVRHEKEFRSGYQQPTAEPAGEARQYLPWAIGGAGALLLIGGIAVTRSANRG